MTIATLQAAWSRSGDRFDDQELNDESAISHWIAFDPRNPARYALRSSGVACGSSSETAAVETKAARVTLVSRARIASGRTTTAAATVRTVLAALISTDSCCRAPWRPADEPRDHCLSAPRVTRPSPPDHQTPRVHRRRPAALPRSGPPRARRVREWPPDPRCA